MRWGKGFFETVGTPFVTGRDLRNDETDAGSCILNQAAAARFFPKQNAMGQMLRQMPNEFGDPGQTQHICQVVGIVKDSKVFHAGAGEGADCVSADLGAAGSETGRPISDDACP